MSAIELKPCPFCGGRNAETSYSDTMRYDFRRGVYCPDCGGGIYPFKDAEAEAIEAWNTRAERTCHDKGGTGANDEQVFNCSKCGCVLSLYDRDGSPTICTSFVFDYPRYCPECGAKVVDA